MSFKAYLELSSSEGISQTQVTLRSELQGSGVSLIDTPKSGRKDVADKMIIADILAFALDVPPPARIVLLSGDRDFAYPLSLIRGRGYQVVLITPPVGAVPILKASANYVARWRQDVLGMERDGFGKPYEPSTPSKRSSSPGPATNGRTTPTSNRPTTPTPSTPSATNAPATSGVSATPAPSTAVTSLLGPGAPPVPAVFAPLVQALGEAQKEGNSRPLRSRIALRLTSIDKDVYEKAGAASWRDYIAVAEAAGIVILGSAGKPGTEWVALRSLDPESSKAIPTIRDSVPPHVSSQEPLHHRNETPKVPVTRAAEASNTTDSDDEALAPPEEFIPLIHATYIAERRTRRSPPLASDVGAALDEIIANGRVTCPPTMTPGSKAFGTYITIAYKHRVAKLTPSERSGVSALQISPAYSAYINQLRKKDGKLSSGEKTPSDPASAFLRLFADRQGPATAAAPNMAHTTSQDSTGVYKSPFPRGGTDALQDGAKTFLDSPRSTFPWSSSKKSAYDVASDVTLPHSPSGTKILVKFFPLANCLLFQRRGGHYYSTEKEVYSVVSKHKHVGHQIKDAQAFEDYLKEAERAGIITMEPGFKEGSRHVRLSPNLCDPAERSEERGDRLPVAGADPFAGRPSSPSSPGSSPSLSPPTRRRQLSSSSASDHDSEIIRRAPTIQDRTRFKPLMDVMIALRKQNLTRPRGDQFASALESRQTAGEGWKSAEIKRTWFQERNARNERDYCGQAQTFGFVVIDVGPANGESGWSIRLSERYEALLTKPGQ